MNAFAVSTSLLAGNTMRYYALATYMPRSPDAAHILNTFASETESFRMFGYNCLMTPANAAAASVLCGSILAGHTSDADDFGDVAVYLGPGNFGPRHEREALWSLSVRNVLDLNMTLSPGDSDTPKVCDRVGPLGPIAMDER